VVVLFDDTVREEEMVERKERNDISQNEREA